MKTKLLDEIHPGEILLEDFMRPMAISVDRLAKVLDVSPTFISEIIHGDRAIAVDIALRLGPFFSMNSIFWLNLQSEYDLRIDGLIKKKP